MRHRPIFYLVLCFEAGLATGLSRFLDPLWAVGALLAGWAVLRRTGNSWMAPTTLLGLVLGLLTRSAEQGSCAGRLPAGVVQLTIRLSEPVGDGMGRARVPGRCRGEIPVRFRSERTLPAGSRWEVTGRWIPTPRFGHRPAGLLVVSRFEPRPGQPGIEDRFRNRLSSAIGRLYGTRAGLVDALITGRRGDIDPTLNAAFARSGLVHLLSISGFHVGVMFGWTVLLLRALRVNRARRTPLAALVALAYVGFLGWPAPATRAALLCCLGGWAVYRQRHLDSLPLLAVTCLLTTVVDPWALFDLGGWLSAAAFAGMLVFTRWSDRAIGQFAGWRILFASLGATLATAPFTAAAFGSVALAGIGLNFAAIPLAAVVVPVVFLSVLLAPIGALAQAFAAGGGLGLAGLEQLARTGSAIPFGAVTTVPGIPAALPWIGLLLFALWTLGRRNTGRRAALRVGWGISLAGLATLIPFAGFGAAYDGHGLALHFLNVGQGDAALIRTPRDHWILVDGGPADGRHDAGREVVLPFLVRNGVRRLAAVVVSHAHLDHVGGIPSVLEAVPADLILEPAEPVSEPSYLRMLTMAEQRGIGWRGGRAGDSIAIDGVLIRILHPDTSWSRWREDLNDDSVVLQIRFGEFQAILAGDLGVKAESLLISRVGRIDLLKVGHHGSAGSTGRPWLEELQPRAAVISVGRNRYGHPASEALARLREAHVEVWRTDRDGAVTVTIGDSTMTLRGRSRTGRYDLVP